jgi:autotransporter-associated beta strand protein
MAFVKWIGSTGFWSNAGNWDIGFVPTAADEVTIGGGVVTNNIAAVSDRLYLAGSAVLTSFSSLTVGSEIRIGSGGGGTATLAVTGGTLSAPEILVGFNTTGLLTVSGNSTVTGSIVVGDGGIVGSVIVGGAIPASGGTINGNIALGNAGSSLTFRTTNQADYGGNISGAGSILIDSAGQITSLTGDNSGHSGTTTVQSGTLRVGNGGSTGTLGTGAVVNNGTLAFEHADGQYNHGNAISGSGNLVVRGAGIEILIGNNSYSGTTSVESGILAVGLFGTTGTLGTGAVIISAGANLDLIRSDTQLVANAISGAGDVRVYGNHTAILTGTNSYDNTTIFAGSTLQIGNGGTTGRLGAGAVTNDGTLVFNHNLFNNQFHGNAIGGSGGLTVNGQGREFLSGVSSYTGATTINGFLGLEDAGSISNSAIIILNGTGRFDISSISGASASVRDAFLTAAGTEITLFGKTLIVTHADSFAGPGRFSGSSGNSDAVVFNVASADFTLAGATTGAVFTNWTDGQDSITINGNAGANILTGDELSATTINGGAGNDRIVIGNGGGNYDGGADSDTLVVGSTMTLTGTLAGFEALELSGGAGLTLTGSQASAGMALNTAVSGTGALVINMDPGLAALTKLFVFSGSGVSVTINGTAGTDLMKLGNVAHTANGGDGIDQIKGGSAADTINGGNGNDKINGAAGADILTGGAGNDVFKYASASDSGLGAASDRITDFAIGQDRLNFAKIDANAALAGDQAFSFLGTAAFANTGIGQLRYLTSGSDLIVQADVNGDGAADMEVVLQGLGGQVLGSSDFVL